MRFLRTGWEKRLKNLMFHHFLGSHPQTPLQSLIPCGFPGVDYKRPDFINGIKTTKLSSVRVSGSYKRPDFTNWIKTRW